MDSVYQQQQQQQQRYPQPFYSPAVPQHPPQQVFQPYYHHQPSTAMWSHASAGPQPMTSYNVLPREMFAATPRLTTTVWEDQCTLCYQVDVCGVCVTRRQDNDMINGTKLLNVVGMSRGKRDGILKNEKGRLVVRVGAMSLKGVWITFQRAKDLALKYKIMELVYPLFAEVPSEFLSKPGSGSPSPCSSSASCSSLTSSAASETDVTAASPANTPESLSEYPQWQQQQQQAAAAATVVPQPPQGPSQWDYLSGHPQGFFQPPPPAAPQQQYDPWLASDCASYPPATAAVHHDILSSSKRTWDDEEDDLLDDCLSKRFRTFAADEVYAF